MQILKTGLLSSFQEFIFKYKVVDFYHLYKSIVSYPIRVLFVFIGLTFITLSLNGQDKKVQFTYEINGNSYNGSVKLMGVNETVINNQNAQVKLRPGGSWTLGCPDDAEYCGMMLVFKDMKLGNPNHEGRIYYRDYANLKGFQVDTRGSEFKSLGQGGAQAIVSFGVMKIKDGRIGFKLKISDGDNTVSAKNAGSEVIFSQNYSMKKEAVTPIATPSPKPAKTTTKTTTKTQNSSSNSSLKGKESKNSRPSKPNKKQPLLTDDEYWKRAQLGGTIAYYEEYLDNYPAGEKKTWALAKIDSLEWDNLKDFRKSDNPITDKLEKYYAYLDGNEEHKEAIYQTIDSLNWEQAQETEEYVTYLNTVIELKDTFPDLKTPFLKEEALALRFNKICEGRDCRIKFENVIGGMEIADFKGADVNIIKIENNEAFIEIGNPKSKYVLDYEDKLGRTATFILGLEDYFSLDFSFKKGEKKIVISELEGGVPPYFLQIKSEGLIVKQIPLGNKSKAEIELNEIDDLPNEIQVFLTDADKQIEKHLETLSLKRSGEFVGSQLFFLLIAATGFSVIGLIFLYMFRQNKKKAEEWDY